MENRITAHDSVRIDKELERIPEIIDKYSAYFYAADQKACLRNMRNEIMEIFDFVFVNIDE